MSDYTNLYVSVNAESIEKANAFVKYFSENIDYYSVKVDQLEEFKYAAYVEGENPHVYAALKLLVKVDTDTLSDSMDNIPSLLAACEISDDESLLPHISDDWSVAVFMDDKPDGLQIHEATYHLYRKSQDTDKTIVALESQNEALHRAVIALDKRVKQTEENYRSLMSYLHSAVNIKKLHDVVIELANTVDDEMLGRHSMNLITYQ